MVESAPHDRKRLLPSMAKPIEPAMKAKNPICGSKPPRRAVAICSGIAIAASVSPAIRSAGRKAGCHEASEANSGQDFVLASCVIFASPGIAGRQSTAFRRQETGKTPRLMAQGRMHAAGSGHSALLRLISAAPSKRPETTKKAVSKARTPAHKDGRLKETIGSF